MANLAPHRFVFVFLLCCFLLGLAGCGGGSSSMAPTPTPTPLPFFSGLYQIDSSSSLNSAVTFSVAGSLEQSGNNVTGVMHLTAAPCSSFNTDIPVNGTLGTDSAGDFTVTLALTLPGGQALALNMIHPGGHLSIVSARILLRAPAAPAQPRALLAEMSWVLLVLLVLVLPGRGRLRRTAVPFLRSISI